MQDDRGNALYTLSQADVDAVADALYERMKGPHYIPPEKHWAQHQWVEAQQDAEHQAKASRRKVVENVVGSASTVALLAFFGFMGKAVIDFLVSLMDKVPPT